MAIELDPGRPASSRSVSITFGHVRSPTTWGSARLMPSMKPLRKRVYAQQLCGMVRLIGQSPSDGLVAHFWGPQGGRIFLRACSSEAIKPGRDDGCCGPTYVRS